MKRALVLSLIILSLGVAAYGAGAISGSISADAKLSFGTLNDVTLSWFASTLEVNYTIADWTFGALAYFTVDAFDNIYFEAEGTLGAFSGYGWLDFDPKGPAFNVMYGEATVSIAGVDLYFASMLQNISTVVGSGFSVGGSGMTGDVKIGAYVFFNMLDMYDLLSDYGFDWGWAGMRAAFLYEYWCGAWAKPNYFGLADASCAATFTELDILVTFPFTCLDVRMDIEFTCAAGFNSVCFEIDDLDIGIPWLLLDDFDICYTVQTKTVAIDINLILGDVVCITPYLSIVPSGDYIVDGLQFNGVTIDYTYNGVSFSAGTLLQRDWYRWLGTGISSWGFTPTGGVSRYSCEWIHADYDEFFAVEIDGDSCCGGAFSVGVYNWFDIGGSSAIFDWAETTAYIDLGVGTNTELRFGVSLMNTGLNYITAGVTFSW